MEAFHVGHMPLALGSELTWGVWIWALKVKGPLEYFGASEDMGLMGLCLEWP